MSQFNYFESFEGRRLMSVVPVVNTNDDGAGSLRQAILSAAAGDVIDMTAVTGTINLTGGQITINKTLTLRGSGETSLTVSGNNAHHIFVVNPGATLTADEFTMANGSTDTSGGAILNRGNIDLQNVTIKDNKAFLFGGGIYSINGLVNLTNTTIWGNTVQGALEASGGGLYMEGGTLTVSNSTFSQNQTIGQSTATIGLSAGPANGGAIYLHNTAASTITNSTIGDNSAQGGSGALLSNAGGAYGGAIYTNTSNTTLLNHVTIANNDATGGGLLGNLNLHAMSTGGGVYSVGTGAVSLLNSLVAQNSATNSPDLLNTLVSNLGDNLIGIYSGNVFLNGVLGNLLGTTLAPLAPGLTSLADNGGDTMTYGLSLNSPAINKAAVDDTTVDQRGLFRRNLPDIGAFELNANRLPDIAVNAGTAVAGVAYSQSIAGVDADGDTIVYSSPNLPSWLSIQTVNGVTSLVGTPSELDATTTRVRINAFDGFQTASTTFNLKVGIPGIDLSPSGLLRLNGTEFDDELSITLADDNTVRVFRDGFKRNFALADVKKVQIFGFAGKDNILVDIGKIRATIFAGADNDTVNGGAGADYISGGDGNDMLTGNAGNDRVDGDGGRDRIYGNAGNDTMHGGDGKDILDGGIGRNRLFGDAGDDTLYSLLGNRDILDGGLGNNGGNWNDHTTVIDAVLST